MSTQQLTTGRFGQIEYSAEDVVTMLDGVLGFPEFRQYLILQHKEGSPFRWLQSVDEPRLSFLVVDPCNFVPDYAPVMEIRHAQDLNLAEDTPRLVYTIVTIPQGKPEELTLNLAGPIVINAETRSAKQIVLEDSAYSIKYSPNAQATQPEATRAA